MTCLLYKKDVLVQKKPYGHPNKFETDCHIAFTGFQCIMIYG